MSVTYTQIADLLKEAEPPADGTLHDDSDVKAVVFGFGAGQELSEHRSSRAKCA